MIYYKLKLKDKVVDTPVGDKKVREILHIGLYHDGKWIKWLSKEEFYDRCDGMAITIVAEPNENAS